MNFIRNFLNRLRERRVNDFLLSQYSHELQYNLYQTQPGEILFVLGSTLEKKLRECVKVVVFVEHHGHLIPDRVIEQYPIFELHEALHIKVKSSTPPSTFIHYVGKKMSRFIHKDDISYFIFASDAYEAICSGKNFCFYSFDPATDSVIMSSSSSVSIEHDFRVDEYEVLEF
uniref:Uncharacterized protein n=1 Tax=Rhizobium phage IG49 TaxID=3129228 RepID=A0AAU8HYU1_9CAUD